MSTVHVPVGVRSITAEACVAEQCDHGDECPTVEIEVCVECMRIAELVDPYSLERGEVFEAVRWPCATRRADLEGGVLNDLRRAWEGDGGDSWHHRALRVWVEREWPALSKAFYTAFH